MTKSMTQGSPIKLILSFALPLLLGNVLQQLYNMADGVIVGKFLGENALSGVGCTSSIQFFVIGFCTGLCTGFGIPIARSFGAKCYQKTRKYMYNAIIVTAIVATVMTVICALFCSLILNLLQVPKGEIYDYAYAYLLIIFLGIPFTMLYNLMAGILRSVGDSIEPFVVLVIATVINIILDIIFVMELGWGCAGAGLATIMSQAFSGIACTVIIIKKVKILHLEKEDRRIEKRYITDLLVMGVPMGLQFSITAIGSMIMQASNNALGVDYYISGFTAGAKIKQFAMCPYDAIGTGVSVFCGQNLGAEKLDRIKKGFRSGVIIAGIYGILIGLVLIFFGEYLSMLFLDANESQEAIMASARYLRAMGYFYWVLAILCVSRMGIQGIGFSGLAVWAGAVEMIARTVVCLVFVNALGYGYSAICYADQTAWCSAVLYLIPIWILSIRIITKRLKKSENARKTEEEISI